MLCFLCAALKTNVRQGLPLTVVNPVGLISSVSLRLLCPASEQKKNKTRISKKDNYEAENLKIAKRTRRAIKKAY